MMKFTFAASRTMTTIRALLHHFHLKNYKSHQLHQNLCWLCHGLCSQVASLSLQWHRFDPRPVPAGFVVDEVALGQAFL
jgi:hypothetical protein